MTKSQHVEIAKAVLSLIALNPRGEGSAITRFQELYKVVRETIEDAPLTEMFKEDNVWVEKEVPKKKTRD